MIVTPENKFVLIDWRQDFGGLLKYGDLYYDLGKLYAGIILNDDKVKKGNFGIKRKGSKVYLNYKGVGKQYEEIYLKFLKKNNYDIKKTKIIMALSFLNMSPLHKEPFNHFVYHLGKKLLEDL